MWEGYTRHTGPELDTRGMRARSGSTADDLIEGASFPKARQARQGGSVHGMSHRRAAAAEEGTSRWRAAAGAPSFVLLMPDDFPRNFLGAAHGLTPTLDRLRTTGVSFARAYTTAPLCSPSRYCAITGRHASSGLTKHTAAGETRGGGGNGGSGGGGGGGGGGASGGPGRRSLAALPGGGGVRDIAFQNLGIDRAHGTVAGQLGAAGYNTAFVGKWHLGTQAHTPGHAGDDAANSAEVRLAGYGWAADVYYDNDAMDRRAHQPEWMAVS